MAKPDNPQAFPAPETTYNGFQTGMTLRDYFAGQVMPSWALATDAKLCAKKCYEYADAMLVERNRYENV